jgi:hypothetical protein
MNALQMAFRELERFKDIVEIKELLQFYNAQKSRVLSLEAQEDLKNRLNTILSNCEFADNALIQNAAHRSLLALHVLNPKNTVDPITQETFKKRFNFRYFFPKRNLFIVDSLGLKFDLYALIEWHHSRPFRCQLGETQDSKYLLNPLTNLPFSKLDGEHIIRVAKQHRETISNLSKVYQETPYRRMAWLGIFGQAHQGDRVPAPQEEAFPAPQEEAFPPSQEEAFPPSQEAIDATSDDETTDYMMY